MIEHDTLQRFIFENTHLRGEIVRLRASYQAITNCHDYPPAVRKIIGEALAAIVLLSATIKFKGSLILQIQGNGPLSLLVVQSDNEFHLRAVARCKKNIKTGNFNELIGDGQLVLTVTMEDGKRYQGIVSLTGKNLAEALQTYFQQSEQLPTQLYLASDLKHASGLLLQSLPGEETVPSSKNYWEHITTLTQTITPKELLKLTNHTILHRLYHEENVRLFETEPVSFRCNCSQENIETALRAITREEVDHLLEDQKVITITCEFCNKQYAFDAVDIEKLFSQGIIGDSTGSKH